MNDPRPVHGPPDEGQTPLDPDEAQGLIPSWIRTRGDLNEAEATNLTEAYRWADRALRRGEEVAGEGFLRGLHAAMFGRVWRWAGTFRTSERNIGVAPHQIAMQLRQLFDDTRAWRDYQTYDLDGRAVRLHHHLTRIHPFPNGNGRTSRLMADYYRVQQGAAPFTWGQDLAPDIARRDYLQALRAADVGDYAPLQHFVGG